MREIRSSAAGTWVSVPDVKEIPPELWGREAFVPRPLPEDLGLASSTHRVSAGAQEALGRLDEAAVRLGDLSSESPLVRSTQVREVQRSASLDGVSGALLEVLAADLPGARTAPLMEARLARYVRASDTAFEAARRGVPVDTGLMCAIAASFAEDTATPDGVWRQEYTWLSGTVASGRPLLLAPPPGPDGVAGLEQFVTWAGSELDLSLVVRLALAHYQLEVSQPFALGNGHIARLFVSAELARTGVLRGQVLPISTWIDDHKQEYHDQIRRVADTGDYEPWIAFFGRGIQEVCYRELALIGRLEAARVDIAARVSGRNTGNIRKIVADLVATPVTNHRLIHERLGITRKNAGELCKRLVADGVLAALDDKTYGRAYYSPELIRLLSLIDPVTCDSAD
ncbi:Fic family protein [Actinokineospora sp. G85]|uniref:Fic family protein n=1 Tax=Actinokineospora sp. G85 TaxID=3406626 RepID=UPI003C76EAA0